MHVVIMTAQNVVQLKHLKIVFTKTNLKIKATGVFNSGYSAISVFMTSSLPANEYKGTKIKTTHGTAFN